MKYILLLVFTLYFATCYSQSLENYKPQPLEKPTKVDGTFVTLPAPAEGIPTSNLISGSAAANVNLNSSTSTGSPEAGSSNKLKDIPVNLFTGQPIINLPIYSLNEPGGPSLPISLTYNSAGMRGHDIATWAGMNWTTNIQPTITRQIKGIADEGQKIRTGFNILGVPTYDGLKGFFEYGINADDNKQNDSEADQFYLNIGGSVKKFTFDVNKKARFFPEADIKVDLTLTNEGTNHVKFIKAIIVTLEDGTVYFFGDNNENTASEPINVEKSFELEAKSYKNDSGLFNRNEYKEIINTWQCTKISPAFGQPIVFNYYPVGYSYTRIADQEKKTNNCDFTNIPILINRTFVRTAILESIENQTHKIQFNKDLWLKNTYVYNPSNPLSISSYDTYYLNNLSDNRKDLDDYFGENGLYSGVPSLKTITVFAKDNPANKLEWQFNYENEHAPDYNNLPINGYNYNQLGHSHEYRYKLRSIKEPDGNFYHFKYFDDGYPLPSRHTLGLDHWGYLNGALGATKLIGKDYFRPCANNTFADRSATAAWSQYGTMKSISHSTGSSIIFDFENHTAKNFNELIGGNRIKKITNIDSVSNQKQIKKFDYTLADGTSSGILPLKPVYHFDDKINYDSNRPQYWSTALYPMLLSESGRPTVGYSRVVETNYNESETDNLGYSVNEYYQKEEPIAINDVYVTYNYLPPVNNQPLVLKIDTVGNYVRPYKWFPYVENNTGAEKLVAVYGKNNVKLSEKFIEFEEKNTSFPNQPDYLNQYRSFALAGQNYTFDRTYSDYYKVYRPVKETNIIYNQFGTDPIVTTTEYQYKPGTNFNHAGNHHQLVKTISTDSQGNVTEKQTKYAADFSGLNLNQDFQKGIKTLLDKHIINAVIESTTKIIPINGLPFYTSTTLQDYSHNISTDYPSLGLPTKTFTIDKSPINSSFNEIYFDFTQNEYKIDPQYTLNTYIKKYNASGLPVLIEDRFGNNIENKYHPSYSVVSTGKIINKGLPTQREETIEYGQGLLYGPTKNIETNGLVKQLEYYADGKLKAEKDKDGNIVKHIQYINRGDADVDPAVESDINYNRIITRMPRVPTNNAMSLAYDQCAINVQYFDGMGKVVQSTALKASPNKNDLNSGLTEYDAFARPTKSWQMVESTQANGSVLAENTFKTKAKTIYKDQAPYTEVTQYEASPLSRTFKLQGSGKSFKDNNITQVNEKFLTAGPEIRNYVMDYQSNGAITNSQYAAGTLIKSEKTDASGYSTIKFTDITGKTLETWEQAADGTTLKTANVYDNAGRLRYVIPPKVYNNATQIDENSTLFAEGIYAMKYDDQGRIIEKHTPGAGWSSIVYNNKDQVVMTQDARQKIENIWEWTQYDGLGRSIQSGYKTTNQNRETLQTLFNSHPTLWENRDNTQTFKYTKNSFPASIGLADTDVMTVAFFDDYSWQTDASLNFARYKTDKDDNTKGLATGSFTRKLDENQMLATVLYYDNRDRLIQSQSKNRFGAVNQTDMVLNWAAELQEEHIIYRKPGQPDQNVSTLYYYDHAGRKTVANHVINGKKTNLAIYKYDALGRLATKQLANNQAQSVQSGPFGDDNTWAFGVPSATAKVHIAQGHQVTVPAGSTHETGELEIKGNLKVESNGILKLSQGQTELQSINYSYNVRGQLRGINLDENDNLNVTNTAIFAMKFDYHETGTRFDGLMDKFTWQHHNGPQRSYTYAYDGFKRLTEANYTGAASENYTVNHITYDANGNLQTLKRYGATSTNSYGLIDDITYNYFAQSNRLQNVSDAANSTLGFKDGIGQADYAYTADGYVTQDANRNISAISYNYMGLPQTISFGNGRVITNIYDASGTKLSQTDSHNGTSTLAEYMGDLIYINGVLQSLRHDEGRINYAIQPDGRLAPIYQYFITDHLGNTRVIIERGAENTAIYQETHYGPWGEVLQGLGTKNDWPYLYQGKELINGLGYDFSARQYDPYLGRFDGIDPVDNYSTSGYVGMMNNPNLYVNPDGRNPFALGALVGAVGYTLSTAFSKGGFGNWNWGKFAAATLSGALMGGISSGIGSQASKLVGMEKFMFQLNAHAWSGGLNSFMNGGNFFTGMKSGAVGSITGSLTADLPDGLQIASSSVLAGATSKLSGGSFWSGAVQGGIIAGLNHVMHKDGPGPKQQKKTSPISKALEKASNPKSEYASGALESNIGSVLEDRGKYGTTAEKVIVKTKVAGNLEVSSKGLARFGKFLKFGGWVTGGLGMIGTIEDRNLGNISNNQAAQDLTFGGIGFAGVLGASISLSYNLVLRDVGIYIQKNPNSQITNQILRCTAPSYCSNAWQKK